MVFKLLNRLSLGYFSTPKSRYFTPENGMAAPNYPSINDWKEGFLREICKDVKSRGAFPADHFDSNGVLKPFIQEYSGLFKWLTSLEDVSKFDTLVPLWEYKGDGEWEMYLIDTDDWLHLKAVNDTEATIVKQGRRRKLGNGGMVIKGLSPDNGIGDDYDMVDDFHASPSERAGSVVVSETPAAALFRPPPA